MNSANWAQLAGDRAQNTATPYVPDQWHKNPGTSVRPMWSGRWGHAVVVLNQPTARSYLTEEENSQRVLDAKPELVLLGGDDGLPRDTQNVTIGELKISLYIIGRLRSITTPMSHVSCFVIQPLKRALALANFEMMSG